MSSEPSPSTYYLSCTGAIPMASWPWVRILVQVTINRRPLIGRDGHLDQSEAYDINRRPLIGRDGHLDQSEAYHIS